MLMLVNIILLDIFLNEPNFSQEKGSQYEVVIYKDFHKVILPG